MQASPQNIAESNGGRERRERPRHAPSSVSYVSLDNANGGVIVDISEMGMAISSAEPIADGATYVLRFQLPHIARTFETPATLVWTSNTKRNAGVRFESLSTEDRLQIRTWLKDELFTEAFPVRAAARRKLVFSHDTLGDTTPSAPPTAAQVVNGAAGSSAFGASGSSGREVTPQVPRKELADLQASVTTDRSSEFDKLFPSERTLAPELQPRPGKFARLAESTSSVDTTALWMNFPSEAELAASRAAAADAPETAAPAESREELPAIENASRVEVEATAPSSSTETAPVDVVEDVVAAAFVLPVEESVASDLANAVPVETAAGNVETERAEILESAAAEARDETALPSVEAKTAADLRVAMPAANVELEEAQRLEESTGRTEIVAAQIESSAEVFPEVEVAPAEGERHSDLPVAEAQETGDEAATQFVEFEVAPPQESLTVTEVYELPADELIEEAPPAVEEVAPIEQALNVAAAGEIPAELEAAVATDAQTAEAVPAEVEVESRNDAAANAESIAATTAAHIEVPAELLASPLVFASASPAAEEIHDEPVHELNPEPQGPEVAANRLDLLDFSQSVRAPGKFSSANPVSDASIESLLAIAEEEDSAVRRSQALKVVPDRKREPLPTLSDNKFTAITNDSASAQQSATAKPAMVASVAPTAPMTPKVATPDPAAIPAAPSPKPVRKVTPAPITATMARAVAPIASANALPHVALRSASQQAVRHDSLLGDGDHKYRGLVIIAIFVLLAGCFAVGYSRHIGVEWPWNSPSTATTNGKVVTPNAQPPAASAPAAPNPSSATPAIRTPTAITSPNTKSGTTPSPDASNVQPDTKSEASALPVGQPASTSFFPVTAPGEGEAPRMVMLPEETVFDSPRVAIRLRQGFFVPAQPGPEWKHSLERIQVGEAASKTAPPPASQSDAGVVHLRATVGADGTVKNVRPIDGPVTLIPRSVDAIKKWRYQPSLLEDRPVEWQGDFSIEFRPAQ